MLNCSRIRTEELHAASLHVEVPQTVRNDLVVDMTFQIDDEAVITETSLCRTTLEFGEVDVARRELSQDRVETSWFVRRLEDHYRGLVMSRRRRNSRRRGQDEASLVVLVVRHVRDQYFETIDLGCEDGPESSCVPRRGLADLTDGIRCRIGSNDFGIRQHSRQEVSALSGGDRERHHTFDVLLLHTLRSQQR